MKPGSSVLVEGNTDPRRRRGRLVRRFRTATQRIDAAGRALLPGLWDMHSHPEPADGLLLLAAGVTGVRDMAAEPAKRERMKTWDTGETLGPRIVYAGIVDGPGPFQGPTQVLVGHRGRGARGGGRHGGCGVHPRQDLQLGEARARAASSSTRPASAACASAGTSRPA